MATPDFNELQKKLEKDPWPSVYMFKFIISTDNHKIALIESWFEDGVEINHQPSANGKYISITIRQVMLSANDVVEIYKKAAEIEGIISL